MKRGPVTLDVDFKLTDPDYQPLPGLSLRLVLGVKDWQAPDAGVRIVTGDDGAARFTTEATIGRRWHWMNAGFTPFSIPLRVDHLAVAAELEFVVPRQGGENIHRWLYTADIDRLPGGDCSTFDLDRIYAAGANGRFTRRLGSGAAGPNFQIEIDGWVLCGCGYRMWNYMLGPDQNDAGGKRWHLQLAFTRMPKPRLPDEQSK
jgi:hypothetical protein